MIEHVQTRAGAYADSVTLMLLSRDVAAAPGVRHATIAQATPLNVGLLDQMGFALDDLAGASPDELLIAVRADDDAALQAALALVDERLRSEPSGAAGAAVERPAPRSLTSAARRRQDLSLALVSVPGEHALYECARAIDAGLHVFCFSEGPTLEQEAALKRRAIAGGLLFMGPDCGTAIIDGVALGFANAVRRGPVGIVGASGTGTQAVTCLLDIAGVGISHAIGVGGRDLSPTVGAAMTLRGLELLAADAATEVIVVVSKAPDAGVAARVAEAAARTSKPTVLAFPGLDAPHAGFTFTTSLEAAARQAAELAGSALPFTEQEPPAPTPGAIRGLFCGGTLRDEALSIVGEAVGAAGAVTTALGETGHALVDFGDDELTRGRAHPMIDPSLRDAELERQAADPAVGVVLLDVVLGYGSHPDPAAELAPRIERALAARPGDLSVIVSICGTEADPQGLERQAAALRDAGAIVTRANAAAARMAVLAAGHGAAAR